MNTQSQSQARAVVADLVSAGLVDPARDAEAASVVQRTLGAGSEAPAAPLRRRMSEVAGYVGGAFVVGAAFLFLANSWADLGLGSRVGILLGTAALLAGAAVSLAVTAGGAAALRRPEEAVRRRLASVLATGAAACAAFGVGLMLSDMMANQELAVTVAALTGLLVALAGYRLAPTTVGQAGTAVAAFVTVPSGLGALHLDSTSTLPVGVLVLLLGVGWLALAEAGRWHEQDSARVIGSALAVIGSQIPLASDSAWVGYLLTAAVGGAAFWLYVVRRAWPYLATGVVAVTLAVPEAVDDWSNGSVGAAGVLLAAGVTLLVAALLGLRLRQEVEESAAG